MLNNRLVKVHAETPPKFTPKPPRKIYQFHKDDFVGLEASLTTLSSDYL